MQTETHLLAEKAITLEKQDLIEIYDQFNPPLFRYAVRLLGDKDLAEDCVAETFSRFLQAVRGGGGPRENVRAYLYRAAHNWITDHYRRKNTTGPLDMDVAADPLENPSTLVANLLERERVRQALFKLSSEQRQVILLRFFEDWPHEEVAAAIGKTAEATRALQYRALAALRKILLDVEEQ
jgi:RNA polymerase sigma-70 factor, ECF subfamily